MQREWVEGSGPNRNPYRATARCRSAWTRPGSTTAQALSGSTSTTRFMYRLKSRTTPAPMALPATEVPAPRAVTGTPAGAAADRTASTSSEPRGYTTAVGGTR